MTNLIYFFRLLLESIRISIRRLLGKKKVANWDFKTELIWATTRLTLISSNKYGLKWLKKLSSSFQPKPKLAALIQVDEVKTEIGNYLKITPNKVKGTSEKLIIYFHGGGYVTGSPKTSIEFISRLAIQSNALVLVPFYPTAPEKTYPAAHQFAEKIVEKIQLDFADKEIYLAGDSAGGALVLSTINRQLATLNKQINGCILISPWTEPTSNTGTVHSNAQNDVGDEHFLRSCYETYLNGQTPSKDFPLTFDASNLVQLPRTLITVGTAEMLLDQNQRLHNYLKDLNTDIELITFPSMFHTFWNLAPSIKEADQLIKDISKWLNK